RRPVDVVGEDEAAIHAATPACATDLHPSRRERIGVRAEAAQPGRTHRRWRRYDQRAREVALLPPGCVPRGRQCDAAGVTVLGQQLDCVMRIDRADLAIDESGKNALGLAEGIAVDDGRAARLRVRTPPLAQ